MDKETLSNYGWIVICVLVLAVMLALATPFGTFIADGFKATYTGLFDTGDSALDVGLSAVGVTNTLECGHGRKESGDHSQLGCGHFACEDCGCVPASCGVDGHWSGDSLDHSAAPSCNEHEYVCQCDGWVVPEGGKYITNLSLNNGTGKPYNAGDRLPCDYEVSMYDEYMEGNYYYKYQGYYHYTYGKWEASDASHGWGVYCYNNVENPGPMLESINGKPITNLSFAFTRCKSLTTSPSIPSTVTNVEYAYMGTALVIAPELPTGITSLNCIFYECANLTTAPVIPSSVTNMKQTFWKCTSLTGTMTINAEPAEGYYSSCFRNVDFKTQNITFVGTASLMDSIGATGKNYCAECNGTCQGNH